MLAIASQESQSKANIYKFRRGLLLNGFLDHLCPPPRPHWTALASIRKPCEVRLQITRHRSSVCSATRCLLHLARVCVCVCVCVRFLFFRMLCWCGSELFSICCLRGGCENNRTARTHWMPSRKWKCSVHHEHVQPTQMCQMCNSS